jgi:hypothetical protein
MTSTSTSASAHAPPRPGLVARLRERWGWHIGLLAVTVAFVFVQAVVVGLWHPIGWDEAVLYTQVVPDVPPVFMEPHRTRGLALLVAPIALFDPSMEVLRGYILLLAAIGLYAAFATWLRPVGGVAVLAAALFATFWVTTYYAVELLPSLPIALLAIAAGGLVADLVVHDEVRPRVPFLLGIVFLLAALIRPPEAVLMGAGLGALVIAYRGSTAVRVLWPAAAGGVIGVGAWFIEGYVRFGFSPAGTLASAAEYSVEGERFNQLPLYLASLEDRVRCGPSCIERHLEAGAPWELPPARTSLYLLTLALAAVLAVVAGRDSRRPAIVAAVIALPVLAFYGYSAGTVNIRYLMPVIGVGFVAAAVGAGVLWQVVPRGGLGHVARAALLVPVVSVLVWQSVHGGTMAGDKGTGRHRGADLAAAIEPYIPEDGRCAIGSVANYPQIQYWTRCRATRIASQGSGELQEPLGELGSYVDLSAAAEAGDDVFAIIRVDPPAGHPVASWEVLEPRVETVDGVFEVRRWREGDPIPPPPCPEDGGERQLARILSTHCP